MTQNNKTSSPAGIQFSAFLLFWTLAYLLVLLVNGALPFVGMPTLGQAVWTTGFSQSFANESILTIHAHNFGAPHPAAMAFGLAGGWVASLFIRLGLHAADAYTLMTGLWLALALYGAYRLARSMDVSAKWSILAAVAWCTMPVVWNHVGYSMLSLGIALLPFYFYAALNLFSSSHAGDQPSIYWKAIPVHFAACVIAVFMDGYSFMMFAAGSGLLGLIMLVRRKTTIALFLAYGVGLGVAYLLYTLYIGKGNFEADNLDFFRGWGADISFFFVPTSGVHWFADAIGWGTPRSMNEYFGDDSVWITTFCLPLLLGALTCLVLAKAEYKAIFLVIAVFGFYMSLGPSFKLYSTKPAPELPSTMEAQYALAPTGTGILSEKLPGFNNMRASYRWAALGCLGAWMLVVMATSSRQRKVTASIAAGALLAIFLLNLPNLPKKLKQAQSFRAQFMGIDKDLLTSLKKQLNPKETIAFLPWRNDFLVNYLSSKLKIITYNIGGDKNYKEAQKHWPAVLSGIPIGTLPEDFTERLTRLLAQGKADAVVLPYIDMLWAAHGWPYPAKFQKQIEPGIHDLEAKGYFEVTKNKYYSLVRLKSEFSSKEKRHDILSATSFSYCAAPSCLQETRFTQNTPSTAGLIKNETIISRGKSGFLHFGPYKPLNAGSYLLTVRGAASRANGAWVDVVSQKGGLSHGKFPLRSPQDSSDDVLISVPVRLAQPAQDIEVRVYVSAEDELALSGYTLFPYPDPSSPARRD